MHWHHRTAVYGTVGLGLFVIVCTAAALGTWVGNGWKRESLPPMVLNADTASAGKSLSMATGLIDRNRFVEGLFVLDHLSGLLQCWVINPRTGAVAGIFTANVNQHLELERGGDADYVMVTGSINIETSIARRGNFLPAGCVCYVGDGNTGKVVGYTLLYDQQMINRNGTQRGELEIVTRGIAREIGLQRDNE